MSALAAGPIRELHLELTHRCNMRCVMCHHWAMPSKDELGMDRIRGLVEGSLLLQGVETVVLTGGEPWLRSDVVDVAAFLAGHYPRASIGILSNLWGARMIRGRLLELRRRGVRPWLGSSLDGLGEAHDRIRGRRGAFRSLLASLDMLRRDFPEIPVSLNFTITPKNHRELWPAYRFAAGRGLGFGAQLVVDHEGLEAPERFHWREAQLGAVERQIDRILRDPHCGPAAYWSYLKEYARRPRRYFKDCPAGSRFAMLTPEGGLFFCPVNKHRLIGDIRERDFDALWRSRKAQRERGHIASGRCHCWLACIAYPALEAGLG